MELDPLTILVGPNASGKTTILESLDVSPPMTVRDFWQHDDKGPVAITKVFDDGHHSGRSWDPSRSSHTSTGKRIYLFKLVHFDIKHLRAPNHVREDNDLAPDGSNLANVYATLPRTTRREIAERLCELVPVLTDIDNRPSQAMPGFHRLVFQDRWNENVWYEPDEVSDGTMLLLAFLVVQHQEPPVDLLAVEEPERSLHPYLLGELVAMLRKMAHGEIGPRPVQVVLSTHSAELLEYARPEEVRFMRRSEEDGSVSVERAPVDSPRWEEAFKEYRESLGTAWLSGGLGGVP
jgi:hypothetical protein